MARTSGLARQSSGATQRRRVAWGRFLAVAALGATLAGCGLKAAIEDCQQAGDAIKAELGVAAECSYNSSTTSAGKKVTVTIRLASAPAGDAGAVQATVTDIVKRKFRSPVDEVTVTF
jgi:hypothetical protein